MNPAMNPAVRELDVRPILKNGGEPFQAIMDAVNGLGTNQRLRLLATFYPRPLLGVMKERGFDHEAREIGGGDWEVIFIPSPGRGGDISASAEAADAAAWPDPSTYLDLADLEPPEPMVRILAAVEQLPSGQVVFAALSREPIFLFPELERRGHQWVGSFDATGTVFRIFIRVGDRP